MNMNNKFVFELYLMRDQEMSLSDQYVERRGDFSECTFKTVEARMQRLISPVNFNIFLY